MTWGIIGALEQEVALIRQSMELERTEERFASRYYVGRIGNQNVAVVCCSIGKINATTCAMTLIREFGAEAVVNVGLAGCVTPELGVLDVVLSQDVAFHDLDPELFARYYPYQKAFAADPELLALAREAIEAKPDRTYRYGVGRIATGDVFVEDRRVKEDIVSRLSPLCVEMEGAAVGQVAFMNGVPFLIIRAMSDNADEEAGQSFDNLLERASEISAGIILDMVRLAAAKGK